jgi:hypothetical protein
MSTFITDLEWEDYEATINNFHDDAFQQTVVWRRSISMFNKLGQTVNRTVDTDLKGLINYNHFRSWPINKESITGQVDKESMLLYINNQYLADLDLLDEAGVFKFNPDLDKFIVDNIEYAAKGNSQTAQTKTKKLLHFIVLKREEKNTI